jgi:hypothetical protein
MSGDGRALSRDAVGRTLFTMKNMKGMKEMPHHAHGALLSQSGFLTMALR